MFFFSVSRGYISTIRNVYLRSFSLILRYCIMTSAKIDFTHTCAVIPSYFTVIRFLSYLSACLSVCVVYIFSSSIPNR